MLPLEREAGDAEEERGRRRACARRTGQGRRVEDAAPYQTGGEETHPTKTKAASDEGGGFVFVFKKVTIQRDRYATLRTFALESQARHANENQEARGRFGDGGGHL